MIPSEPVRTPLGAGSSSAALPPGTRSPSEVLAVFLAETAVTPLMSVSLPVRGVVSGPMGSGKSAALRALRDELAARGLTVGTMPADAGAVDVLLVDDAETLSGDELDALHAWAARPDASVVVAHAPARRGLLRRIGTLLEKTCPPVLLGEVTPEQIIEATRVPPHCAHALVRQTGGLTWLTLAAVDVHDKGVCDVDPAHRDVVRILRGTIAHRLDLLGLARGLGELTSTARAGRTSPADMSDGTITITNVGVFGIDTGTPILNPGEAAILAFGAIRQQPWVHKGKVKPRHVTQLALSFDHRLVDGELGSRVLADVAAVLADPSQALVWS